MIPVSDAVSDEVRSGSVRLLASTGLLITELLLVSVCFDAMAIAETSLAATWSGSVMYAGQFARFLSVFGVVLVLIVWPRSPVYLQALSSARHYRWPVLGLHGALFGAFFGITALLFAGSSPVAEGDRAWLMPFWLSGAVAVLASWCLALAPAAFWRDFLRRERLSLLAATLAALAAWAFALYSQALWEGLAGVTLTLSHAILVVLFANVSIDTDTHLLGVDDFLVTIGVPCSGYEGIGLISLFTALYLYVFRAEFRFPHALLLFPVGIISIWLFNLLRIAALIAIGARISPEIALGGFHSQAGWISFLLVSVGLLYVAHSSGLLAREPDIARFSGSMTRYLPTATLLPLLTLLLVGLTSAAFSGAFDWLYPLKIMAAALMLALCWPVLHTAPVTDNWRQWLEPVLVGAVVFAAWLLLVPVDHEQSALARSSLRAAAPWAAALWLAFRVAGAVVVVPIVEELAFRGYLLCRLARSEITLQAKIRFSWLSLIGSSVLFGLLHSAWFAGILAGFAYGLLRYRCHSIRGPIVAHAVTNLLLTVYVLATGHFALW